MGEMQKENCSSSREISRKPYNHLFCGYMKKRSYCFICVLLVTLAVVVTACLLASKSTLGFIPDSANIIRLPKRGWVVYVFPADFNSIIPEAALELASLGFVEGGPGFLDPSETRWFTKTYTDGRKHHIEIYNQETGVSWKVGYGGRVGFSF